MIAFDKYFRTIVDEAGREARREGLATFEAQHLLLAIAAAREPGRHRPGRLEGGSSRCSPTTALRSYHRVGS